MLAYDVSVTIVENFNYAYFISTVMRTTNNENNIFTASLYPYKLHIVGNTRSCKIHKL